MGCEQGDINNSRMVKKRKKEMIFLEFFKFKVVIYVLDCILFVVREYIPEGGREGVKGLHKFDDAIYIKTYEGTDMAQKVFFN